MPSETVPQRFSSHNPPHCDPWFRCSSLAQPQKPRAAPAASISTLPGKSSTAAPNVHAAAVFTVRLLGRRIGAPPSCGESGRRRSASAVCRSAPKPVYGFGRKEVQKSGLALKLCRRSKTAAGSHEPAAAAVVFSGCSQIVAPSSRSMERNSSSVSTGIPRSWAFFSLEPAASPATT